MPLIECPDCKKQVSDAAPTCPGCGRPMPPPAVSLPFGAAGTGVMPPGGPKPVQTVELTSKKWKIQQLGAGVGFILGIVLSLVGLYVSAESAQRVEDHARFIGRGTPPEVSNGLLYFGLAVVAASFIWAVTVQLLVWWHHK
jgi:hypothetical protein